MVEVRLTNGDFRIQVVVAVPLVLLVMVIMVARVVLVRQNPTTVVKVVNPRLLLDKEILVAIVVKGREHLPH